MCALSFDNGSHRNFHSYTKTGMFLYMQKEEKPILFTNGILRALLSNKNSFFAFLEKVNNSIASKLCVNLINICAMILKKKWRTTQIND